MRIRFLPRGSGILAGVSLVAALLAPGSALAFSPVPNDDFANRITISEASLPYRNVQEIDLASTEANEHNGNCFNSNQVSQTIWYSITVAATQLLQADTLRDNFPGGWIDIYRGSTLATLEPVACNDGRRRSDQPRSLVTWRAKAGVHYQIRVSDDDQNGRSSLAVRSVLPVDHDAFAAARNVSSIPFRARELTTNATLQNHEVQPRCAYVGATLWYRFTPSRKMLIEADTFDSDTDTVLAVYEGTSLGTLTEDLCDNDAVSGETNTQSNISFYALANHTYYFQVGGYHGSTGRVSFRVHQPGPIANDMFGQANTVQGSSAVRSGNTNRATLQPGEPAPSCFVETGATVWYKHTATGAETLTVTASGTDFNGVIAIWQGSSLGSLSELNCSTTSGTASAALTPGETVYISLGGAGDSASGPFNLLFDVGP
jgi:hypothetical protein